jgi:hypothetical protein
VQLHYDYIIRSEYSWLCVATPKWLCAASLSLRSAFLPQLGRLSLVLPPFSMDSKVLARLGESGPDCSAKVDGKAMYVGGEGG